MKGGTNCLKVGYYHWHFAQCRIKNERNWIFIRIPLSPWRYWYSSAGFANIKENNVRFVRIRIWPVDTLTLCEVSSYGINIRENIKLFDFYWIGMGEEKSRISSKYGNWSFNNVLRFVRYLLGLCCTQPVIYLLFCFFYNGVYWVRSGPRREPGCLFGTRLQIWREISDL